MPAHITSVSNDRVKRLVKLQRDPAARRREGRFCVETERELRRAIDAGFEIREVWLCDELLGQRPSIPQGAEVVEASEPVLRKIAYRDHPAGFVALLDARQPDLAGFDPAKPELLIVISGLEKPGNVGAIARSAAAAGAGGLLIDRPGFDLYNPNAVRASTGAIFNLPILNAEPQTIRDWLADRGVIVLAATPEATLTQLQLNLAGPTAIVLGAEARGLDDFWRDAADLSVAIHMPGQAVDSLNVSASAAVLLFEAVRQRLT